MHPYVHGNRTQSSTACHQSQDISNKCCRNFWSSIVPLALVVVFLCLALPIPRRLERFLTPFKTFLPVLEAESILHDEVSALSTVKTGQEIIDHKPPTKTPSAPIWRTAALSFLSILEALTWLALGTYSVYEHVEYRNSDPMVAATPYIMATTWLYATLRPIVRPTATPPCDLFVLFVAHWIWAALEIGVPVYMHYHAGWLLPTALSMGAMIANLVTVTVLLVIVLLMPLSIPSETAKALERVRSGSAPAHSLSWIPLPL